MLKGSHRLPVLPHTPSTTLGASLAMVDGTDLSRFPEVTLQLEPGDRKRSSMQPPLRVFSLTERLRQFRSTRPTPSTARGRTPAEPSAATSG